MGILEDHLEAASSSTIGGNVVQGPLSNALVGLDYNGDGIIDSATVRPGSDGGYSLTTTDSTYTIVAIADETTIDTSSGTVLSGHHSESAPKARVL